MSSTLAASMLELALPSAAVSDLDDIEVLARVYRPRLLRFVTAQVRNDDLAFSIVQDTLLKAHRNRGSFRGDCSINTWMTGIALNLVRDHARTEKFKFWKRAESSSVDASEMSNHLRSPGACAETAMLARERAAIVHAAVGQLSENQRAIFVMRFMEEMELAEIAAAMKMPLSTVKTHLHRATKAIRARVRGEI